MVTRVSSLLFIVLITTCLFEAAIAVSFRVTSIWKLSPNPFIAQKLYRSQRNVIQFMPECAKYDVRLGYVNRPGLCEFSNKEFDTTVVIGDSGRINAGEESIKNNSCNIVFIGDSTTFGWGVEQKETFSGIIGERTGCKVYNLGVSSYGTARQVIDLNSRGLLKRNVPTHVFIQYSDNDIEENRTFKNHDGFLPVMSERQYLDVTAWHKEDREYFFPKYTWVILEGVFQKTFKFLSKKTSCVEDCDRQSEHGSLQNNEVKLFLYALSKLELGGARPIFTIFELNGTNRNDCIFSGELEKKLNEIQKPFDTDVAVLPMCKLLTREDYFVLDDHLNALGHAKVADFLLQETGGL